VTASEIVDFIQILDLKKASGPDKISHKMLKIAPEKIAEYTISSKCSSLIVFRSGGIQLLLLLDLISIFIIFQ
jgi:hypothetical protein